MPLYFTRLIPRSLLMQSTALRFSVRTTFPRLATRFTSTLPKRYYPTPSPKKGIKIGHLFLGLAAVGISATSYGLYQFYSTFTIYPKEIRAHLRSALRSSLSGENTRADKSFATAYDLASQLYTTRSDELGPTAEERRNRLTGIVIAWGGMWENAGELDKAIQTYEIAFQIVLDAIEASRQSSIASGGMGEAIGGKEIMRAVSLALKMGDLITSSVEGTTTASTSNQSAVVEGEAAAERYYVFAVEEMLRLSMTPIQSEQVGIELLHETTAKDKANNAETSSKDTSKATGLVLAETVSVLELASGLERLGEYYSRRGNIEYAQPLFVQAIAVLLPPPPKDGTKLPTPSIQIRCHAATLMNNLSSLLVSMPCPDKNSINQAAGWARQALVVSAKARTEGEYSRRDSPDIIPLKDRVEAECELCSIVATFNLGALAELSKDRKSAKNWFEKSKLHSNRLGLREGVQRAETSIKRLNMIPPETK